MKILGINKILNWLQITSSGKRYTCPMKEIKGELFFLFKEKWHKVADYLTEHTSQLLSEAGKNISRTIKK